MSTPSDNAESRSVREKYRNPPPAPPMDLGFDDPAHAVDVPARALPPTTAAPRSSAAAQWTPAEQRRQQRAAEGSRLAAPTADEARSERIRGKVEGAQRGWRATVNRILHTNLSKSREESNYDLCVSDIQRSLRHAKRIAVLSGKGSAGKTSVSLNMGATIATQRSGSKVLALSIDPLGNISARVRSINGTTKASVMSLAAESDNDIRSAPVVSTYMQIDRSGLNVLGASPADGAPFLTPQGLVRVLDAMNDLYNLTIIDFGLNIDSPVFHEGLSRADQLVLCASTSADSIDELHSLITTLKRFGGKYEDLLQNAVVAFSQTRPGKSHIDVDAERTRITSRYNMPVVTIPWDEHISEGGPMSTQLMEENTRLPYVWLAAEVMNKLASD